MESEAPKSRAWSGTLLVVLALVWLLGPPYLFAKGIAAAWDRPFIDHERVAGLMTAAGIVMVGAPVAASVVAWQTNRKNAPWLFGFGAILSLMIVLLFIGSS
ncbi:hypothetical protein AB0F88_06470 [Streptosporangium sp. NPDC023963]|uniref:hypothetical protein n=1 Tax=Streptosporangium sp. NPDC023963 TaxID=3155608 RepID=UPI00342190E9